MYSYRTVHCAYYLHEFFNWKNTLLFTGKAVAPRVVSNQHSGGVKWVESCASKSGIRILCKTSRVSLLHCVGYSPRAGITVVFPREWTTKLSRSTTKFSHPNTHVLVMLVMYPCGLVTTCICRYLSNRTYLCLIYSTHVFFVFNLVWARAKCVRAYLHSYIS